MKTRMSMRKGLLAAAALLTACGGGELLLLTIVTPLNGAWRLNGDVGQEGLQFQTPLPDEHLFSSRYAVTAAMLDPSDLCGAPVNNNGQLALVGSFDNGDVVLRARDAPGQPVCIQGRITSLIRFDAVATGARPARFYRNSRVDVQLDLGLWVSENGATRLKFSPYASVDNDVQDDPLQACDVSAGAPVVLDGLIDGFQTATGTRPTIAALTPAGQTAARYTDIVFADGATITLRNAAGAAVTLKRQREATQTFCP